jgi:hypothetical protein
VGLPLCNTGEDFTCSQLITHQLDKSVGRNHLQTITQFDRDSLKEATYVNDVIIDFWLLLLSRNSSCDSLEYFFYVTLLYNIGSVPCRSGTCFFLGVKAEKILYIQEANYLFSNYSSKTLVSLCHILSWYGSHSGRYW